MRKTLLYTLACIYSINPNFASDNQATENFTNQQSYYSNALYKAEKYFLNKDFCNAIKEMNKVPFDDFNSQNILLEVFNPNFFCKITEPFVQYIYNNNIAEDLTKQSWFKALSMIPIMVDAFKNFNGYDNENFTEIASFILALQNAKKVAHAYSLVSDKITIGKEICNLGLSYPVAFIELLNKYLNVYKPKLPEKIGRASFDKNLFMEAIKGNDKIQSIPVSTSFFVATSSEQHPDGFIKELVHLTSLTIYKSDLYGTLIAYGDRSGPTYRGIRVYQLKENESIEKFIEEAKESLYSPILNYSFLESFKSIKKNLIEEIPIMQQLGDYCGFQSCAELNKFASTLFAVMDSIRSKFEKPLDLNSALETAKLFVYEYHTQQMNGFREHTLLELIEFEKQHPNLIDTSFFKEVSLAEQRYGGKIVKNEFGITNNSLESYVYYLKQKRYKKREFSKNQHEKITDSIYKIISMFKKLDNDFNEELLEKMNKLDQKIILCHAIGFTEATKAYWDKHLRREELLKNPFYSANNE